MRTAEISAPYEVSVTHDPTYFVTHQKEWDELLENSSTNSIFLSAAWLDAWCRTLGQGVELKIVRIFNNQSLVAACAFYYHEKEWLFAAHGAADYADLLVDMACSDDEHLQLTKLLLNAVSSAKNAKFVLARIPRESRTLRTLESCRNLYVTETATVGAPIMSMAMVEDRLSKKSIIRHARKLSKMGDLVSRTSTDIEETVASLGRFFSQHIARWEGTPYPSLFLDPGKQDFYHALTHSLGGQGWLRYATVELDQKLVAAHFGFQRNGIFTWYKPTYDPTLAKLSPGEVLLKHLLEQAQAEQADFFDFTIGEEAFKLRFSTKVRDIVTLHVTRSRIVSNVRRLRLGVAKRLKQ